MIKPVFGHHMILRHFKTDNKNKIDYNKCDIDIMPLIIHIIWYIEKYKITDINILSSPIERTFITSLYLYIKLKEYLDININMPVADKKLLRDPNKKIQDEIVDYYTNNVINKSNLLTFYITHSSIYEKVFTGILLSHKRIDIPKKIINKRINRLALSIITVKKDYAKYKYNIILKSK